MIECVKTVSGVYKGRRYVDVQMHIQCFHEHFVFYIILAYLLENKFSRWPTLVIALNNVHHAVTNNWFITKNCIVLVWNYSLHLKHNILKSVMRECLVSVRLHAKYHCLYAIFDIIFSFTATIPFSFIYKNKFNRAIVLTYAYDI